MDIIVITLLIAVLWTVTAPRPVSHLFPVLGLFIVLMQILLAPAIGLNTDLGLALSLIVLGITVIFGIRACTELVLDTHWLAPVYRAVVPTAGITTNRQQQPAAQQEPQRDTQGILGMIDILTGSPDENAQQQPEQPPDQPPEYTIAPDEADFDQGGDELPGLEDDVDAIDDFRN